MNSVLSLEYLSARKLAIVMWMNPDFEMNILRDPEVHTDQEQVSTLEDYSYKRRNKILKKLQVLPRCLQEEIANLIEEFVKDMLGWNRFLVACGLHSSDNDHFFDESVFTSKGKINTEKAWEKIISDDTLRPLSFRSVWFYMPNRVFHHFCKQLSWMERCAIRARDY